MAKTAAGNRKTYQRCITARDDKRVVSPCGYIKREKFMVIDF
jgi:hypothetical protein